jgi:hypothetical protein
MGDSAQPFDGLGAHTSRIDHAGWILVLGIPQDERRLDTTLIFRKMFGWQASSHPRRTAEPSNTVYWQPKTFRMVVA